MNNGDLWAEYAQLQKQADSFVISDQYWATDDALDALLRMIKEGANLSVGSTSNLLSNRAAKYRRRRQILAANSQLLETCIPDPGDHFDAIRGLDRVRYQCTSREWQILGLVGVGFPYSEIAANENIPEATIKTWVRRARIKFVA